MVSRKMEVKTNIAIYLIHLPPRSWTFFFPQITSYDGILRYTVSHEMDPGGKLTSETDVQLRVGCVFYNN